MAREKKSVLDRAIEREKSYSYIRGFRDGFIGATVIGLGLYFGSVFFEDLERERESVEIEKSVDVSDYDTNSNYSNMYSY